MQIEQVGAAVMRSPKKLGLVASNPDAPVGQDQDLSVPFPFRLTEKCVEYGTISPKEDQKIIDWRPICSRLEVVALTRNERNEDWGRLLRFHDQDGCQKTVAISMDKFAGTSNEVRALLLNRGLRIESDRKSRDLLDQYIQACQPGKVVRCVDRIGWTSAGEGETCFVFPDVVVGSENVVLQASDIGDHAYHTAGLIEEWQKQIGSLAVGNSRIAFAISSALAAPLLEILDMEGGGFHFTGSSSLGKTTLLRVAGSVFGGGSTGYIRTWRATTNGLEAVASQHNHTLLCLDEIGQVEGREVGNIAYMLANGIGKARADRYGGGKRSLKWKMLFISTGEQSLAEKMSEDNGGQAKAGQEIRVLDIPADAGQGHGVFEELHGFASGAALSEHFNEVAGRQYGLAAREFIKMLAEKNCPDFRLKLKEGTNDVKRYLSSIIGQANGQIERAITRFAVVAAAGELASSTGILPWPLGEARNAAAKCLIAWVGVRGGTHLSEVLLLVRQVKKFIEAYGESRFVEIRDIENHRVSNRAGYRYLDDDGTHYLVLPEMMEGEICRGIPKRFAAKALLELGLLIPGEQNRAKRKERLPHEQNPVRVYHLSPKIMSFECGDSE